MPLPDVPTGLAGAITILALVGLGIFGYPALLKRRGGVVAIAACTALLALLFYAFDRGSGAAPAVSATLALLWALAPVVAGVIVHRLQTHKRAAED